MFFLFNTTDDLLFYQIFLNTSNFETSDGSIIHDLITSDKYCENIPLFMETNFKICVLDNYILFCDTDTKENNSFTFKTLLKKCETNNNLIFENNYSKIKSKIPVFMDKDYSQIFYVNFKIYKINDNLYFVNCFDKILNKSKKYFVSSLIDKNILKNITALKKLPNNQK